MHYHTKEQIKNLPPGSYCFYCLTPNPQRIIGPQQILFHCLNCRTTDGLVLKIDPLFKTVWHRGGMQHFTVGALLQNETTGKYLLMKKRTYPQIIDVIAGHVRSNETTLEALQREVQQETGLALPNYQPRWEGLITNYPCRYGAPHHYWYLFANRFRAAPRPDLQEVDYFKEYSWEELLNEPLFGPHLKPIFKELGAAALTPVAPGKK
ncbi:MAG: NUDIX hydrolase [Candidatus Magasanikbacteria bacterium]|nr:NUDIX hydrolase [Candidatus Magasanikbacteria bacterium]